MKKIIILNKQIQINIDKLIQNSICVVLLAILIVIWLKIPIITTNDSRDFTIIYLSSTDWRHGNDPYKCDNYHKFWIEANGPPDKIPTWPSLYPICTFPLISPLTFFSWPVAKFIWMFVNCLAYISLIILLFSLVDYHVNELSGIILFGFLLFFMPVVHAIAMGQPAILAILFGVLSWRAAASNRWIGSGIFLALSLSLKLNLGVIFLGYFIIYRQWKIVRLCLFCLIIIISIGIFKLGVGNFSWISSWIRNMQIINNEWAINRSVTNSSNIVFLLNLQYPLYKIFYNKLAANAVPLLLGFIDFLILLRIYQYNKGLFGNLTMLTTISTIVLISSYHRLADASVLVLLIIYIILAHDTQYRKYSNLLILLLVPFYLPGPRYLEILVGNGTIPSSIATSWWWNGLVLPYQVYCLLLMSIIMMFLVVTDKRKLFLANKSTTVPGQEERVRGPCSFTS